MKDIKQIIPAHGWMAVYSKKEEEEDQELSLIPVPLICWALMETPKGDIMVGLVNNDNNESVNAKKFKPDGHKFEMFHFDNAVSIEEPVEVYIKNADMEIEFDDPIGPDDESNGPSRLN